MGDNEFCYGIVITDYPSSDILIKLILLAFFLINFYI